jgi:hypothetical protein
MTLYNRYLIVLVVVLPLSTALLAAYGVQQLGAYFSLYLVEYLIITMLFTYLHPRARRILDNMGYVLFGGFLILVGLKIVAIIKVAEILRGPSR